MIRVLHVLNWFRRGGLETLLLRILRDYDRSRFHMDACCIGANEGYLADEARSYGAEILTCPKSVRFRSFSRRFARLLEGKAYDIVHAHADTWAGPLLRGAQQEGVPVRIAHIHNIVPSKRAVSGRVHVRAGIALLTKWSRRLIARHATRVLGVSEACLDVRWRNWRHEPDRYGLWTGGVEIERFAASARCLGEPGVRRVLFVGSFTRAKNHAMLVEVFSLVANQVPEAVLQLAGEGPEQNAIRRSTARAGLGNRVAFLGLRDDIPRLLAEADVFLSCSVAEGLPIVLLEAQAAGVPVVASDIPPHREALCPELHPFHFALDDPQAACESVTRLLQDDGLRRELGKAGRRFVMQRYESRKCLGHLQSLYEQWVAAA